MKDDIMPSDEMPLHNDVGFTGQEDDFVYQKTKKNHPFDVIQQYNEAAFKNWDQNVLELCKHCGRTFTATALKHHSKACTAERPLKKKIFRNGEQPPEDEEEKVPLLGLAARQAAAEKQGKF